MAATIARAQGFHRESSTQEVTRLGHDASRAVAATWRTFATAYVSKDGSGYVEVRQNGRTIHRFDFGPEAE